MVDIRTEPSKQQLFHVFLENLYLHFFKSLHSQNNCYLFLVIEIVLTDALFFQGEHSWLSKENGLYRNFRGCWDRWRYKYDSPWQPSPSLKDWVRVFGVQTRTLGKFPGNQSISELGFLVTLIRVDLDLKEVKSLTFLSARVSPCPGSLDTHL